MNAAVDRRRRDPEAWEFRANGARVLLAAGVLGFGAWIGWNAYTTKGDWRGLAAAVVFGLLAGLGLLNTLCGRSRIRVSRSGIEVRSLFREKVIRWEEFADVTLRPQRRGGDAVAIELRDGGEHVVMGLWVFGTNAKEFLRIVREVSERVPRGDVSPNDARARRAGEQTRARCASSSALIGAVGFALFAAVYMPLRLVWPVIRSGWNAQPQYHLVFVLMGVPSLLVAGCLVGALWQDEEITGGKPTRSRRGLLALVALAKALVLALLAALAGGSRDKGGGGSFAGGGAGGRW